MGSRGALIREGDWKVCVERAQARGRRGRTGLLQVYPSDPDGGVPGLGRQRSAGEPCRAQRDQFCERCTPTTSLRSAAHARAAASCWQSAP